VSDQGGTVADFDHLSEEGAQLAACGDAERLRSIREDSWIDYPAATTVLAVLNEFLSRPRTTRMPSVAIYADSGAPRRREEEAVM
jgi:Bacterial TniB protein